MAKRSSPPSGTARKPVVKSKVSDATLVARRREQLVTAAIDLFSEHGYDRTTMLDIARKAGISVGLIYQYAQTKEDVLFLSLVSVLDSYRLEIPRASNPLDEPLPALWAAVSAYARIIDRRRAAALLAYRSTHALPRAQRRAIMQLERDTNELLAAHVRACVEAGLFRAIDVDLAVYQLVLHAHGWALKHWRLSQIASFEAYLSNGFDMFVRACATPEGLARFRAMSEAAARPATKPGTRRPR